MPSLLHVPCEHAALENTIHLPPCLLVQAGCLTAVRIATAPTVCNRKFRAVSEPPDQAQKMCTIGFDRLAREAHLMQERMASRTLRSLHGIPSRRAFRHIICVCALPQGPFGPLYRNFPTDYRPYGLTEAPVRIPEQCTNANNMHSHERAMHKRKFFAGP